MRPQSADLARMPTLQAGNALALLGPQSPTASLAEALATLGTNDHIGVITAGWRDAEGEINALIEHLAKPVTDLALYERVEDIFAVDQALFNAHRERQDILKQLQRLYRVRLRAGADACYRLMKRTERRSLVTPQLRAAVSQLRALDRFHARQIAKVHLDFEEEVKPYSRPAVRSHRAELESVLNNLGVVLIAGGHVAVLASRMRLLGMSELLAGHPLAGWSAGAMVLTEQLVLFHDRAPQGRREPELLDVGLGRCRGVVALPAASLRLDMARRDHLGLMAKRFAPSRCLTFDHATWASWHEDALIGANGVSRIRRNGALAELRVDA